MEIRRGRRAVAHHPLSHWWDRPLDLTTGVLGQTPPNGFRVLSSTSGLVSGSGGVKHQGCPLKAASSQGPRPPLTPAPSHVLNPLSFELGKAFLIHASASANCFSNASRTPYETIIEDFRIDGAANVVHRNTAEAGKWRRYFSQGGVPGATSCHARLAMWPRPLHKQPRDDVLPMAS